jgi:hypothetical protein
MRNAHMSRRAILGSGAAVALAATTAGLAVTTGVSVAGPAPTRQTQGGVDPSPPRRGYAFLDAAMDGYPAQGTTRLAQSYTDQSGLFSTAFVYDNALAILAYLADNRIASLARAQTLGEALLFAQDNDPDHADGRLRQAYNVGPYVFYDGVPQPDGLVRADGKANVGAQFGFLGTAVGDMAWPGIALVALARRTGQHRFTSAAVRIGTWIQANGFSTQPLGGYTGGVDGANIPYPYSATEHNIDLVGFFGQLADLTGDRVWLERRDHAAAFVGQMWNPTGKFFYTGTNDGATINPVPIPEDTQTWSYLALRQRRYAASVGWAAQSLYVVDTPGRVNSTLTAEQTFEGVTFSSASLTANESAPIAPFQPNPDQSGVWFEGNGHLALALRLRGRDGDEALARRLQASSERAQDQLGDGQTVGGLTLPVRSGVVSASSPLDTGFGFGYYPYRHVGATCWYLLAASRENPLGC